MIDETQKSWKRQPSDKEWHEMLHGDYSDPRCKLCAAREAAKNDASGSAKRVAREAS